MMFRQFGHQIAEREIALLHQPRLEPIAHRNQFAVAAAIALRPWLQTPCLASGSPYPSGPAGLDGYSGLQFHGAKLSIRLIL
jgi:hypothetical protein